MKALLIFILSSCFALPVMAKKPKAARTNYEKKAQLKTEMSFSDSTVLGKYANSSEATAAVEQEKKLIKVVEPRPSFSTQLKKSKEWK